MSNFRFISYLYEYKKEQKGRNTGFVRVRGLNDFVELNMQVKPAQGMYEVYVHYETLPEVQSILVGNIRAVNGECHGIFRNILPILRREGISFSNVEALTIWQDGIICHGTEWTESNCLKRLLSEEYKREKTRRGRVEFDAKKEELEEVENNEEQSEEAGIQRIEQTGIDETSKLEEENIKKTGIEATEIKKIEESVNNGLKEQEEIVHLLKEKEKITEPDDKSNDVELLVDGMLKEQEEQQPFLGWPKPKSIEELMLQLKPIPSFGNDTFLKCVKMMPKDIGLLHSDDWYLGKNSFLLHGYFAYQYLMLGYIRFQDGGKQAILGVPGVYNSKDKYLAQLFGFSNFIQAQQQEIKTGSFGYWITSVHENI